MKGEKELSKTCNYHGDSAIYRNKGGNYGGVWCEGYLFTPNIDLYRLKLENEGQIVGILVVLGCAESSPNNSP